MEVAVQTKNITKISFKDPKKEGQFVLRAHRDKRGKMFQLKDELGNDTQYTLRRSTLLDVSDPFNKKVVEGFRNHPLYSQFLNITNMEEEAQVESSSFNDMVEAGNVINGLNEMLPSFCRAIGINTVGLSETRLVGMLHRIAKSEPKTILDANKDPMLRLRMMLHDGREAGVFDVNGDVWSYRNQPMGNSPEQAIGWLSKQEDLLEGIKREITTKLG